MNIITSKDNQKIKLLKKIRDDSKIRIEKSLYFVEGERNVLDINIHLLNEIYISEDYNGKIPNIDDSKIFKIPNAIYDNLKNTKNSQGIIATVFMPKNVLNLNIEEYLYGIKTDANKLLILDGLQDPGNVGTILRTAEASGFNNILLFNNCVDIYSPKVIRASMSSISRLNFYKSTNTIEDIKYLKKKNYKFIGTFLDAKNNYIDSIYQGNIAIVVGNEANGISDEMKNACDIKIKIPMSGKIESLNVSIATAIILYEVKRQYEYIY